MRVASLAALLPMACSTVVAILNHKNKASVCLFSPSSSSPSTLQQDEATPLVTYTAKDANAIVSSFLGIEEYERLRQGLEIPHQLIVGPSSPSAIVDGYKPSKPLLLVADKTDEASTIDEYLSPSTFGLTKHHRIDVAPAPDVRAWTGLLQVYTTRMAEKFGWSALACTPQKKESERITGSTILPGALSLDETSVPGMQDESYKNFLSTLKDLSLLSDGEFDGQIIRLDGIKDLISHFGADSQEVRDAKDILRRTLDQFVINYPGKIAFFLVPGFKQTGQVHSHKMLRRAANAELFSTIPLEERQRRSLAGRQVVATPIVPTTSKCYTSEESLRDSTNECSLHGIAVAGKKIGFSDADAPTCWVCKCGPTEDESGKKHYWSGEDCSKEDISSDFFLIVGAAFLLVFIAVASVQLLSNVGSEPLPSTLAAMGGNAAGHHKRD